MSAIYFAVAMRDNGGGTVIGSELVPEKVATAWRHLADAGLADYADIREGDARQTLSSVGGPVDFALIDGWPNGQQPSLAREVIEILAPQIRTGGYVMNDNAEPDFLQFVRHPTNGFTFCEPAALARHRTLCESLLKIPVLGVPACRFPASWATGDRYAR